MDTEYEWESLCTDIPGISGFAISCLRIRIIGEETFGSDVNSIASRSTRVQCINISVVMTPGEIHDRASVSLSRNMLISVFLS